MYKEILTKITTGKKLTEAEIFDIIAAINLTKQRFDKLTVLYREGTTPSGKAAWVYECECGNIITVTGDSLRSGHTKSCGCVRHQLTHDLTVQEFGFLEVIEPVELSITVQSKNWKTTKSTVTKPVGNVCVKTAAGQ